MTMMEIKGNEAESKLIAWRKELEEVSRKYDDVLDRVCALQIELEEAETEARQLLTKQTRLEDAILKWEHRANGVLA